RDRNRVLSGVFGGFAPQPLGRPAAARVFAYDATPFTRQAQDRRGHLLIPFEDLAGFGEDDHLEAFRVFVQSCASIAASAPPPRKGVAASAALKTIAHAALHQEVHDTAQAR